MKVARKKMTNSWIKRHLSLVFTREASTKVSNRDDLSENKFDANTNTSKIIRTF